MADSFRSPRIRDRIAPPRMSLTPLRRMRGFLREAALWPAAFRRDDRPAVALLPAKGRELSSLLRIYAVAESLRDLGWSTLVIPATLGLDERRRVLARYRPDLIVMQGARHELNRPALYPGQRIVYDMDDADFHLPRLAGPVTAAMAEVELVLAGSRYVAAWCRSVGARAEVVWTGTPISSRARRPQADRPPVVAWAQTTPAAYDRERAFVLDVMARVAERRPGVRLRLFGRRAGEADDILAPFRSAGIVPEWVAETTYDKYLRALDDVAVGLSPICPETPFSRGKSFGKVLAYLDRGVPVIASDEADHALFFTPRTAVIGNDPAIWSDAVDRLLGDAAGRQGMADAGFAALEARLSTAATARQVDRLLRGLLETLPA